MTPDIRYVYKYFGLNMKMFIYTTSIITHALEIRSDDSYDLEHYLRKLYVR